MQDFINWLMENDYRTGLIAGQLSSGFIFGSWRALLAVIGGTIVAYIFM